MKKVITYGTFDLFHFGHKRLLKRAKALGDYLIVGVTADDFDRARGKINVQQSLMERMEMVKASGIADEVIVEEYEGQKIDDILRYDVDIFTVGSDWVGSFDYLKEYCDVVYLERTDGVSSTEIRSDKRELRLGLIGNNDELHALDKFERECKFVNGVIAVRDGYNYEQLLDKVDAVYLITHAREHYNQIKLALEKGKHVLCESPISMSVIEWTKLMELANSKGLILMDAIRTAYATAYHRMLLLVKSGCIGQVVSVDASCSSLKDGELSIEQYQNVWNSICAWGPNAMLPVFQILGTDYKLAQIQSRIDNEEAKYDSFTKISFVYPSAVASIKVGKGVKTEGELIISGTTGYVYVPAPWWKTEYFEIRREDPSQNKRYFYQLDGEGIRYEIVSFIKAIQGGKRHEFIDGKVSNSIVKIIEDFYKGKIYNI